MFALDDWEIKFLYRNALKEDELPTMSCDTLRDISSTKMMLINQDF